MPRVTVRVTGGERRNAHRTRGDKGPPVTDRASLRHVADQSDPRLPRHGRLEQVLKFRKRRNSVEDDARAYDLKRRVVEGDRPGTWEHVRFVFAGNGGAKLLNHF